MIYTLTKDGMQLVFVAKVWYGVYEKPKMRNVYGDGFEWYIDDQNGVGLMPLDRATGWVIAKR